MSAYIETMAYKKEGKRILFFAIKHHQRHAKEKSLDIVFDRHGKAAFNLFGLFFRSQLILNVTILNY